MGLARTRSCRRLAAALAAGVVALGCWLGCSEQKHYKTLSIFFDGVPDPNAKVKTDAQATANANAPNRGATPNAVARQAGTILSTHKPFVEENCAACHGEPATVQVLATPLDSEHCMKCHEKVLDAYPAMHGPVVGKACLWCHQPHESTFPTLLRTTTPALCLDCHDRATLSPETDAHVRDTARSCLDCHGGHGGDKAPFLRALATTRPTTSQPATDPKAPQ